MTNLKVINIKNDIVERLAKTFVQAAGASLTIVPFSDIDMSVASAALIAGLSAVYSLVMNLALAWANPMTGGSALK